MRFLRKIPIRLVLGVALSIVLCRYGYRELSLIQSTQSVVLADPVKVRRLGAHFVVGFTDYDEVRQLSRAGAIGGVFFTARNVRDKNISEVQQMITTLQAERKSFGLPQLIIVCDQEGGIVTRLSPPLEPYESLAAVVHRNSSPRELQNEVVRYARRKGRQLRRVGVNMNLSPVVDLRPSNSTFFIDLHSKIADRAISADPHVVQFVATTYAHELASQGVIPTVKHFPGLSRVTSDTHLQPGRIEASIPTLTRTDWLPFQQVLRSTPAAVMVGHVHLDVVDPKQPASVSAKVVNGIIRGKWQHDGLIITDDMNMAPVSNSSGGIGASSVSALNAGVDLLLISWKPREYYRAMSAVLKADRLGMLDKEALQRSRKRLSRFHMRL